MKTNLVTGVTQFELLNDFMPVEPDKIINTEPETNEVTIGVTFPNASARTGAVQLASFTSTNTDVVITPSLIRAEQSVEITLPNAIGVNDTIFIQVEYQYANGETRTQNIIVIR